ncbi:MAG: IS1634 family transposase [Dethiobacteria bacterium]|jgi:transposase
MFVKITKSGKYEYVQLVQSYRENGQTKHKVMLNLGRLDHIAGNPSFQRLAIRLQELSGVKNRVDLDEISEGEIVNYGYTVYKKLFQELGLKSILNNLQEQSKAQFSLSDSCFLMVLQHLLNPCSKRGAYLSQDRYVQLPQVDLNHLYRSLDILHIHKEKLEDTLYYHHRTLLSMHVDVVFFDVTTFHFESVKADSLRDFGFSKNGKFNEVQVVLALLVDTEGRPIGYELFPGDTFESKTLESALEKLEKRFGLRQVIIVADRGINSKLNLKRIAERGYRYIVASRIRKMKKELTEKLLDPKGYTELPLDEEGETFRYKVIEHHNEIKEEKEVYTIPERLVFTYSSKRAKKDRADRSRLIEKAHFLLADQAKIKASNKKGGKKYLKEIGSNSTWVLDEASIARDEQFDGYYGLQTNDHNLTPKALLEAYHRLWKIEESFRIMKSTLEVRPVFHWTESRIKGHFVVCFLAFILERTLELKLKKAGITASPQKIREAINAMCFTKVDIGENTFYIKSKGTELSSKILRALRIKPPKNITPSEEMVL